MPRVAVDADCRWGNNHDVHDAPLTQFGISLLPKPTSAERSTWDATCNQVKGKGKTCAITVLASGSTDGKNTNTVLLQVPGTWYRYMISVIIN